MPSKIKDSPWQIRCLREALCLVLGIQRSVRYSYCTRRAHGPWEIQERKEANAELHDVL